MNLSFFLFQDPKTLIVLFDKNIERRINEEREAPYNLSNVASINVDALNRERIEI